jgi:hypothetical protein
VIGAVQGNRLLCVCVCVCVCVCARARVRVCVNAIACQRYAVAVFAKYVLHPPPPPHMHICTIHEYTYAYSLLTFHVCILFCLFILLTYAYSLLTFTCMYIYVCVQGGRATLRRRGTWRGQRHERFFRCTPIIVGLFSLYVRSLLTLMRTSGTGKGVGV